MTLNSDAKLEEKLTLGSINDMSNLVNFNASTGKSENVLLLSVAYKVSPKKYRRLWRKTDFLFEKWHEKFGEF